MRMAAKGVGKPTCSGATPIPAPLFDLQMTLESGQVFHWLPDGAGYIGVIGERAVRVEQQGEQLWVTPGDAETVAAVAHYFALDHPLEAIYATFPQDAAMQEALEYCRGVRIIRQPLWECTATFITSAMKQVKHIAQMSHAIRQRYGVPVVASSGVTLYAYPTPQVMAQRADEAALRECGLGFRARNLYGAACAIARGEVDLEALQAENDAIVLKALCTLPGVGPKIAHCVLLFAYERRTAFPIDVWIERVLRHHYFPRRKGVSLEQLQQFVAKYFGPHGGYAQQYLFHYARNQPRSVWKKEVSRPAHRPAKLS